MPITVTFRGVGLYCLVENRTFENLDNTSTIEEIMQAFVAENVGLEYKSAPLPGSGKEIVDTISYTFDQNSTQPPNAAVPSEGFRSEANVLDQKISTVWQYYRSVKGTTAEGRFEYKFQTVGQPSFATTSFDDASAFPASATDLEYIITWRLVRIELAPEKLVQFMRAKEEAIMQEIPTS